MSYKNDPLYKTVLRSIEEMTARKMAEFANPTKIYPWKFDRSNYRPEYLVQQFTEDQVQKAILAELAFWRIDAIPIDAGMKRARGKMLAGARKAGQDVSKIVNFKGGGLPIGFSDLHGTLAPEGTAFYCEVKAPAWTDPQNPARIIREAGKPTDEQLDFLDSKHSRGAIVLVAWSVSDVLRVLGNRTDKNRAAVGSKP
jgi:hypothetical protein